MDNNYFLILVSAALAILYLVWFCYRGTSSAKSLVKTSSILVLCLASVLADGPIWLSLALGFCVLGDFFLSRGSQTSFVAGVGAFAIGHLAYIAAFLTHRLAQADRIFDGPRLAIILALVVFAIVMARVLYPRAGRLGGPVLLYIPIIAGMAIASLVLPALGALALVVPGALVFLVSDFVLSFEMFVLSAQSKLRKFTPFVVWSTYWLAQMLLLLGLTLPIK